MVDYPRGRQHSRNPVVLLPKPGLEPEEADQPRAPGRAGPDGGVCRGGVGFERRAATRRARDGGRRGRVFGRVSRRQPRDSRGQAPRPGAARHGRPHRLGRRDIARGDAGAHGTPRDFDPLFSADLRRFDAQEAPQSRREARGQGHNQVDFSAAAMYFPRAPDRAYRACDHRNIGSVQIHRPLSRFTTLPGEKIEKPCSKIWGNYDTMWTLSAPLLQVEMERPDLTINWIIIGALLAIALVLSVAVARRRLRERDDDWDG